MSKSRNCVVRYFPGEMDSYTCKNVFSVPENGGIETKSKLKAHLGAEIFVVEYALTAKLLSYIMYRLANIRIVNNSAPEGAFNLLFVSIPPFSVTENTFFTRFLQVGRQQGQKLIKIL